MRRFFAGLTRGPKPPRQIQPGLVHAADKIDHVANKSRPAGAASDGQGLRRGLAGLAIGVAAAVAPRYRVVRMLGCGGMAGVYLAEYGDTSKTAEFTRFVTDIMLSAPSIVLGSSGGAIILLELLTRHPSG